MVKWTLLAFLFRYLGTPISSIDKIKLTEIRKADAMYGLRVPKGGSAAEWKEGR